MDPCAFFVILIMRTHGRYYLVNGAGELEEVSLPKYISMMGMEEEELLEELKQEREQQEKDLKEWVNSFSDEEWHFE